MEEDKVIYLSQILIKKHILDIFVLKHVHWIILNHISRKQNLLQVKDNYIKNDNQQAVGGALRVGKMQRKECSKGFSDWLKSFRNGRIKKFRHYPIFQNCFISLQVFAKYLTIFKKIFQFQSNFCPSAVSCVSEDDISLICRTTAMSLVMIMSVKH